MDAYQHWHESGELDQIKQSVNQSKNHWLGLSKQLIEQYLAGQDATAIENTVTENKLI